MRERGGKMTLEVGSNGMPPAAVIILGAVAGVVWQERNLSFRATARKLRRDRSTPQTTRP